MNREPFSSRWDIDAATRTGISFERGITLVNLRRIELACLLEIATGSVEWVMGMHFGALYLGVAGGLLCIPLAQYARSWTNRRLQDGLVILFIVFAFATKQWGLSELGAQGRVTTGYILTLLTLTLLFVMPPRVMGVLLTMFLASYVVITLGIPVSPADKVITIVNTAIVTVIALISGRLIFQARRSDHEQRLVIKNQNARLVGQNQELDELMAITAHDLRSPLYGLRNLFDLASRRADREPQLPLKVLRDGIYSLDAMIALVTRLLHAHAAEHNPLGTIVRDDVRSHLIAASRRLAPQAKAAGIAVDLRLPDHPVCGLFDSGALAQILDNLLSNAIRFGPSDKPVVLSCESDGPHSWIRVSDEGPGVSQSLRPLLFQKFSRDELATGGDQSGTGMGLFISARLAERMDAALSFEEGENGGATFKLSLPDMAKAL